MKFNPIRTLHRIFFKSYPGEVREGDIGDALPLLVARRSITCVCLLIAISCSKPQPKLDGIDLQSWKEDKNGCGKSRSQSLEQIQSQKQKLLALSELDIVALLGRPDRNELGKRNQKFFYYFLEPSDDCEKHRGDKKATRLAIRFNAMGLAKEVRVEMEYLDEVKDP